MKKRIGIAGALAGLLLSGAFSLAARGSAQQEPKRRIRLEEGSLGVEDRYFGPGWGARLPVGLMLEILDLSDAQKEQIKGLMAAHRTAAEPYRAQLRDGDRALDDATANGQFNEAQIRAIAQSQAQANVEITVLGEKLRTEIFSLLTPEQRAKLEERRRSLENRFRQRK